VRFQAACTCWTSRRCTGARLSPRMACGQPPSSSLPWRGPGAGFSCLQDRRIPWVSSLSLGLRAATRSESCAAGRTSESTKTDSRSGAREWHAQWGETAAEDWQCTHALQPRFSIANACLHHLVRTRNVQSLSTTCSSSTPPQCLGLVWAGVGAANGVVGIIVPVCSGGRYRAAVLCGHE
jgi:hypothetical protein